MYQITRNVFQGDLNLGQGVLGRLLDDFGADIIIGHPTYKNHDNFPLQLKKGILGAALNFKDRNVAFVVSDGSCTSTDNDLRTLKAAVDSAQDAIRFLDEGTRNRIMVIATPYEGYGGNKIPGKGSALKLIFDEMALTHARTLILLDGDLRNEMADWQRVFLKVIDDHEKRMPGKDYFITARYARHIVDASLTRNIVGPLTTLLGRYVPGGISGDIVLSAGAVELERKTVWSEARYKYGTDISTTFDNIANNTAIYEVYLGAKLHDVTDDAKLSVMPGEVIGAALERILYYEHLDGRVTKLMKLNEPLKHVIQWGPVETGIGFINPGFTDVFSVSAKRRALVDKFPAFAPSMEKVLSAGLYNRIKERFRNLEQAVKTGIDAPFFLNLSAQEWVEVLYEIIGYCIATGDLENSKRALNYLYTAAFLEFCKIKLFELGYNTIRDIEKVEKKLGVKDDIAEAFYRDNVDMAVKTLAIDFYNSRNKILKRIEDVKGVSR